MLHFVVTRIRTYTYYTALSHTYKKCLTNPSIKYTKSSFLLKGCTHYFDKKNLFTWFDRVVLHLHLARHFHLFCCCEIFHLIVVQDSRWFGTNSRSKSRKKKFFLNNYSRFSLSPSHRSLSEWFKVTRVFLRELSSLKSTKVSHNHPSLSRWVIVIQVHQSNLKSTREDLI